MAIGKYNKTEFCARLKELRGDRSQGEFAELLGISSQQTYANYESGRIPKPLILQQIAQRTGVTVDFLLSGMEVDHNKPKSRGNLDSRFRTNAPPHESSILRDENLSPAERAAHHGSFEDIFGRLVNRMSPSELLEMLEQYAGPAENGNADAARIVRLISPHLRSRIAELERNQKP